MRRQHEQDASLYDPLSKIKTHKYKRTKRKSAKIRPAHSSGSPDPCSLRRNMNDKVQRADSTW